MHVLRNLEFEEFVRLVHRPNRAHGAREGALRSPRSPLQRGYRRKRRTCASCKLTPDMKDAQHGSKERKASFARLIVSSHHSHHPH